MAFLFFHQIMRSLFLTFFLNSSNIISVYDIFSSHIITFQHISNILWYVLNFLAPFYSKVNQALCEPCIHFISVYFYSNIPLKIWSLICATVHILWDFVIEMSLWHKIVFSFFFHNAQFFQSFKFCLKVHDSVW